MKVWLALLILITIPIVSGFVGNSSNYNITISNIDYGAGHNNSTNYNISLSTIDQPVSAFASNSFLGNIGFYFATGIFGNCFYSPDIYVIALILAFILFIISFITRNNIFDAISGMFLLVVGIAVMINGICDYNDWLTRGLAFICLGLGLLKIFMIFKEVEL